MASKFQEPANTWFEGFLFSLRSRKLSKCTISDYSVTLRKFFAFLGPDSPGSVSKTVIQRFLGSQEVSAKTLSNYCIGLSVFYSWAVEEGLVAKNPMDGLARPRPETRVIQAIPLQHIRLLLASTDRSASYSRPGKRNSAHALPYSDRNRLILLLLLDTGIRVSELVAMRWSDVDMEDLSIKVFGKGAKERVVVFSARTGKALWRYKLSLSALESDFVIADVDGRPLGRNAVNLVLRRLCKRAGVPIYSPHDFRHTFAIEFLRNHPNIFALQALLGHSSLDMVKRYLAISQVDLNEAHRHGSPVDNWGL